MRNIFIYIRRYFNFLVFIFFELICFYLLFTYNRYHNAVYMNISNEYTGRALKRINNAQYYFFLKRTNDSLVLANERLYNKLKQDYELTDTAYKQIIDSLKIDSLNKFLKYQYLSAKVIGNTVSFPNNYIQISRGILQGVEKDLGVIDVNNNVVGTVIDLSNNYGVVMSMLHKQSTISAKLKKSGETGIVIWNGEKINNVVLKDIPATAKIAVGDSVVTSGFTERFPYGLLIGTITSVMVDKGTNNYIINLKTAANFYNLQFVFIIKNLKKEEPQEIMKRVKKANE